MKNQRNLLQINAFICVVLSLTIGATTISLNELDTVLGLPSNIAILVWGIGLLEFRISTWIEKLGKKMLQSGWYLRFILTFFMFGSVYIYTALGEGSMVILTVLSVSTLLGFILGQLFKVMNRMARFDTYCIDRQLRNYEPDDMDNIGIC